MKILHIDDDLVSMGRSVFQQYLATPEWTGPGVAIGVIVACIEQGITERAKIVSIATKISRCRESSIESMLSALAGDDPTKHLWRQDANDRYGLVPGASLTSDGSSMVVLVT